MPNQMKKNSLPNDSKLNPVGKVLCEAMIATGGTIGIAQVNLALAPVGSVLYVQPSAGRLTCEVEVANANALHWQDGLKNANERNSTLRKRLALAEALLSRVNKVMSHKLTVYRPALVSTASTLLWEVRAFVEE